MKFTEGMCDVSGEACFSQKLFTSGKKIGLLLWDWVKKTVHGVDTHWFFDKEKVLDTAASKEGHTDSLVEPKKTHNH